MWVIAVGIVLAVSVTANGALAAFGDEAGAAVALYYCLQGLLAVGPGTLMVLLLDGDTAWPLVAYALFMPAVSLVGLWMIRRA